jgi:hypothetical protein
MSAGRDPRWTSTSLAASCALADALAAIAADTADAAINLYPSLPAPPPPPPDGVASPPWVDAVVAFTAQYAEIHADAHALPASSAPAASPAGAECSSAADGTEGPTVPSPDFQTLPRPTSAATLRALAVRAAAAARGARKCADGALVGALLSPAVAAFPAFFALLAGDAGRRAGFAAARAASVGGALSFRVEHALSTAFVEWATAALPSQLATRAREPLPPQSLASAFTAPFCFPGEITRPAPDWLRLATQWLAVATWAGIPLDRAPREALGRSEYDASRVGAAVAWWEGVVRSALALIRTSFGPTKGSPDPQTFSDWKSWMAGTLRGKVSVDPSLALVFTPGGAKAQRHPGEKTDDILKTLAALPSAGQAACTPRVDCPPLPAAAVPFTRPPRPSAAQGEAGRPQRPTAAQPRQCPIRADGCRGTFYPADPRQARCGAPACARRGLKRQRDASAQNRAG